MVVQDSMDEQRVVIEGLATNVGWVAVARFAGEEVRSWLRPYRGSRLAVVATSAYQKGLLTEIMIEDDRWETELVQEMPHLNIHQYPIDSTEELRHELLGRPQSQQQLPQLSPYGDFDVA